MNLDKKQIAKVIQNARREAGYTQLSLAEKIGISEKHMSKIETGKSIPTLETFLNILDTLNLTLGDFGFNNTSNNHPNKILLQKIANTSSQRQLDACTEVITTLLKYI